MSWYDTESWYSPMEREKSVKEPAPEISPAEPAMDGGAAKVRQRGRKKLWISLTAVLLVAALALGLGIPALRRHDRNGQVPLPGLQNPDREQAASDAAEKQGEDPGFGRDADGKDRYNDKDKEKTGDDADEQMPEDWNEFFEDYYQDTDSSNAQVNIERTDSSDGFSLELKSPGNQELTLQQLYARCSPSIVAISGYTDGKSGYNWGTGVVLSADGLILTNTHVIDACDRATVTLFDDREFEAKLIGADTFSDLAVLKIEVQGLIPAEFGESVSLRVGDPVAAIGNPLGDSFRSTLTNGIVSAISRDISYKGRTMTLLQTNTALNEGNSGGALFNMYGQVVGITNMKMMSSYSSIEGIGFAIPSSTVREVVNSILRYGEVLGRPSIGITVGAIPPEAESRYELPKGLYITDVQLNSDAWAKGVRPGDILTEVNHIPVTTTADVTEIKNQFSVGDSLHFTIWRNGEILEFDVLLMENNELYGG